MKKLFHLSAILSIMLCLASCGSSKRTTTSHAIHYETISEGEMLPSLTKITETADSECPYGGDEDGLFFYALDVTKTGHYDIYRKERPTSSSSIQMTDLGTTGFAYYPAYNKATDKIAFCMGYQIYTMPVSKGKALTQITSPNSGKDNHPCFSPDGSLIVFDRNIGEKKESSEIWIKNLLNGDNILLGKGIFPRFSPDGKKIVFSKYENYKSQIWVMDVDGENAQRLTDNSSLQYAAFPSFSPDGKNIIFDGQDDKGNSDLYIVPVEGGSLIRLTISKSFDGRPYWSTDGYIYFQSDRGDLAKHYNIWRFKYSE